MRYNETFENTVRFVKDFIYEIHTISFALNYLEPDFIFMESS